MGMESSGRRVGPRVTREDEPRAPAMLRHPGRTLAVASLFVAVLIAFGAGLEQRLSPSTIEISGTSASRANGMLSEHFGPTALFPIFLQGPAAAIDRQGPALIRALHGDPRVTTLSPWD